MNTVENIQKIFLDGRIRGHAELQRKHEALEEVFRQLWDLLWKDLADEGDELVVLVTQRGKLQHKSDTICVKVHSSMCPQMQRCGGGLSPSEDPET